MSGAERQGLAESGKTGGKPILVADGSLADRLLHGKKPLEDVGKGAKPPGAKADAKADVKDAKDDKLPPPEDGTEIAVKVSYKKVSSDPKNTEFDDPIKKTVRYNTIEITDMPADGVYIKHWRDDDGRFFFWFSDKEGKNIDGKNHYYPGNVHKLKVGDKVQDVDAQRRKVNDAWNRSKNKIDLRDDVLTISI